MATSGAHRDIEGQRRQLGGRMVQVEMFGESALATGANQSQHVLTSLALSLRDARRQTASYSTEEAASFAPRMHAMRTVSGVVGSRS
jgi:hypothetical protein